MAVVGLGAIDPGALPDWVVRQYPPALALGMACYGASLWDRHAYLASGTVLAAWLVAMGWSGYSALRDRVTGLDAIVMGLSLLLIANLISLAKAGLIPNWLSLNKRRSGELPD